MAASGVAEHDEARRKELLYLRKAYLAQAKEVSKTLSDWNDMPSLNRGREMKIAQNDFELESKSRRVQTPSTYTQEVERKLQLGLLTKHDAESVDRQRRLAHYKMMQEEYSAKLPNRYSSTDYVSQW